MGIFNRRGAVADIAVMAFAAGAVMAAAPANATIEMVKTSSIQGENILFIGGDHVGTTVIGQTQSSGTQMSFTANGQVLIGNGGQAKVTGDYNLGTPAPNDTYEILSLDMFRTDGGFFNNLEFDLFKGSATSVSFAVTDNFGNIFNFNDNVLDNGANFFGFRGIDSQSIARLAMSYKNGGVNDVRLVRLEPLLDSAVPEPATWALLLCGFGMIGVSMRGRRGHMVAA